MNKLLALSILLALALSDPAAARPRVDTILLANGDTVTCEIVRLETATLSVRTPAFGTVEVDWPDVAGLISPQLFEVERTDGFRFVGRLVANDGDRVLAIELGDGTVVEIPMEFVVGIDQRGSNLWASRRGFIDLGFNFAQAGSDTNVTLEAELVLHPRWFRWINSLSATVSDDVNNNQRERRYFQSRGEFPVKKRFLFLGTAIYESNDDLDLVARETAGAVFTWLAVNGPHGRILLGPGATTSREQYGSRDEISAVSSGALLLAGQYHRFGPFGTRAELGILWLPVFSGPNRNRIEVNATFRQKVGVDFTLNVTPYYSYDSHPPTASAPTEDWGWTGTIGWLF